MKEFQLKQLIKEVVKQLNENVKSKHKSTEHEVASDMLDSDYIQPAFSGDVNAKKYLSSLWGEDWFTIKKKLISVSDEMNSPWMDWFQEGVDRFLELNRSHIASLGEDLGMAHGVVAPQDANTMNKTTIKESEGLSSREMLSYYKKVSTLVSTAGADSALKYIFELARSGKIDEPAFKLMVYFCTKRSPINPR